MQPSPDGACAGEADQQQIADHDRRDDKRGMHHGIHQDLPGERGPREKVGDGNSERR